MGLTFEFQSESANKPKSAYERFGCFVDNNRKSGSPVRVIRDRRAGAAIPPRLGVCMANW
jgi:hypothetical protein